MVDVHAVVFDRSMSDWAVGGQVVRVGHSLSSEEVFDKVTAPKTEPAATPAAAIPNETYAGVRLGGARTERVYPPASPPVAPSAFGKSASGRRTTCSVRVCVSPSRSVTSPIARR